MPPDAAVFIGPVADDLPWRRSVVVKDNIDVRGHPTTAGSPAQPKSAATTDACAVARLRRGGLVIAGKANMHELALGATGVNPTFGTPRNPHDLSRISGGSSSGTAAAVASGIVPFGIGTDTGGSVRVPAALTGVVGFRPSVGAYPRHGVLPLSPSRDTVGTIGRRVDDVARLDGLLAARPLGRPAHGDRIRLGVPEAHFTDGLDAQTTVSFEDTVTMLQLAGVQLVSVPSAELIAAEATIGSAITFYEARRTLLPILVAECGDEQSVLQRIGSADVRALFEQFILSESPNAPTEVDYRAARRDAVALRAAYGRAIESYRIDGLLFPTTPAVAPPIPDGDPDVSGFHRLISNTVPGSIAGVPGITLPGPTNGLPVGIALDGAFETDLRLLAVAAELEAVLDGTRASGSA